MQSVIEPELEYQCPDSLSSITHCFSSFLGPKVSGPIPTKCPHWTSQYWEYLVVGSHREFRVRREGEEGLAFQGQDILECGLSREVVGPPLHAMPIS